MSSLMVYCMSRLRKHCSSESCEPGVGDYLSPLSFIFHHLLQVVLELCRTEQITDTETIEMHLERIKSLVSTWAAQVSFSKCDVQLWSVVMFSIKQFFFLLKL